MNGPNVPGGTGRLTARSGKPQPLVLDFPGQVDSEPVVEHHDGVHAAQFDANAWFNEQYKDPAAAAPAPVQQQAQPAQQPERNEMEAELKRLGVNSKEELLKLLKGLK